jgi:hypothetical protein
MKIVLAGLLVFVGSAAQASGFRSAIVSEDGARITMYSGGRAEYAPRTHPDQNGFGEPKISANRKVVGWTVLVANCCTSYPLPRALVLYQHGKPARILTPTFSIWEWYFLPDGRSVAYMESLPHGLVPTFYQLARISDGKTVASFECWPGGMEGGPPEPTHKPEGGIPGWVQAFKPDDCRAAPK